MSYKPKSYATHNRRAGARKVAQDTINHGSTLDRLTDAIRNQSGVKVSAQLIQNGLGKDLHLYVDSYADFIIARQIAVTDFGYDRANIKMAAKIL